MHWWMHLRWWNERWYFRLTSQFGQDLDRCGNKDWGLELIHLYLTWVWISLWLFPNYVIWGNLLISWSIYFLILQFMLIISILLKDKNEVIFFLSYSYDWLLIIQVFDCLERTFLASAQELFTLVILLSASLLYDNMFFKCLSLSVPSVFTYLFIYLQAWFTE